MATSLQITLNHDILSAGVEIPLSPLETWFEDLQWRNAKARDLDGEGEIPLRHWVRCPNCDADASHLGAVDLDDRRVRICTRCQSLFEVADGTS
tara:strand:- start:1277 stop:1558 length:282 start_codon:yes stop_codon:yes gene_type:complete